jgi:hypothetical protein
MTKTQLIEGLKNDTYAKPKWQARSEGRLSGMTLREQEAREVQKEHNKKVNALKKKWAKKLEDH